MTEEGFYLLKDKIFSVTMKNGREYISLPEVLYLLSRDEILSFDALQFYQAPAWHAFLVQVAAASLCTCPKDLGLVDTSEWEQRLLDLSQGSPEAWTLCVPDLQKPAFFQPPVPERTLDKWSPVYTPDDLDVLMSQKNHDMKQMRMRMARPEHWLYALVNLQTTEGYGGQKNYGIIRMSGGYGTRSFVGVVPSLLPGGRFIRDVNLLVKERNNILDEYASLGFKSEGGTVLLWLEPWDGKTQYPLSECDPYFVEVCRRVRLTSSKEGTTIMGWQQGSERRRVSAPEVVRGDIGDPWMPIKKGSGKNPPEAIKVSSDGWKAELIIEIFRGSKYEMSRAQKVRPEDHSGKTPMLVAQALARGQGVTQGWHQRILPLREKVRKLLEKPEAAKQLGDVAKQRFDEVGKVSKEVLKPSILRLLQGDCEAKSGSSNPALSGVASRYTKMFEAKADMRLFDDLWEDIEMGIAFEEEGSKRWVNTVRGLATEVFEKAMNSLPISSAEHYKRVAMARDFFHARLNRVCPSLTSDNN